MEDENQLCFEQRYYRLAPAILGPSWLTWAHGSWHSLRSIVSSQFSSHSQF